MGSEGSTVIEPNNRKGPTGEGDEGEEEDHAFITFDTFFIPSLFVKELRDEEDEHV